ncbi:glycan-binding surface protein [Bacteroides zhangwenhongii]|uniref:glycan-binding surface protein n=1 Tax=Bacteroides zhangwenhongii TaxID=2650157 RepID=UPI003AAADD13
MKAICKLLYLLVAFLPIFVSCSDELDFPELSSAECIILPETQPLDANQLFGVWEAKTSYGTTNSNYFEESYKVEFQRTEDAGAVYSHWFTDADSGIRDSVCNMEYTYEFDGATVVLTPSQVAAAAGASVITGIHTGNNRMLLIRDINGRKDSICTLVRTNNPYPSITNVDRTLPQTGEVITVTGYNLQLVDKVFLLCSNDSWVEVVNFTPGSKEIKFVLPEGDYKQGSSIRFASAYAGVYCYSPAYMFCKDCVFFNNFKDNGTKPYTGTEFEYTISEMGTLKDHLSVLASNDLPEGHSLYGKTSQPEYMLSFFGDTPIEWPNATNTDDKKGYLRFSGADRFQHVLDNCNGLLKANTPSNEVAIQMDIYVSSDGVPEWNTGYFSFRINKDHNKIGDQMAANIAGWTPDAPMNFADGWRTLTIPLSEFPLTKGGRASTIGGLINRLKSSNTQSLFTVVNYPLDAIHPAKALRSFQFSIANIRLVPYATPVNTPYREEK